MKADPTISLCGLQPLTSSLRQSMPIDLRQNLHPVMQSRSVECWEGHIPFPYDLPASFVVTIKVSGRVSPVQNSGVNWVTRWTPAQYSSYFLSRPDFKLLQRLDRVEADVRCKNHIVAPEQ
jgi:hypothetical protein